MARFKTLFHRYPRICLLALSLVLGFLLVLFASPSTSILFPGASGDSYYGDAKTFLILGSSLGKGYTPYIDVFDHKGLYIYYYTFIASYLGPHGVMIPQTLLLSATVFVLSMTFFRLKVNLYSSIFGICLFLALYLLFGQSPNDADMVLPFAAAMIHFYALGLKGNDNSLLWKGNLFAGVAAGIALNIRLSDAMLPFAFVIFFAVKAIKDRKFNLVLTNALICLLGLVCASLPPLLHALTGGFLKEMVEAVIISNFRYVGAFSQKGNDAIWNYLFLGAMVISFGILIPLKRKSLTLDLLLFFAVTAAIIIAIQLIIAHYPHYLIITFPYLSFSLAFLLDAPVGEKPSKGRAKLVTGIISIAVAFSSISAQQAIYWNYFDVDVANRYSISLLIKEEDKKGHILLIDIPPAYYLTLGIEVGYPDFCCQSNHTAISNTFDYDALLSYCLSDECHYLVTYIDSLPLSKRLLEDAGGAYETLPTYPGSNLAIHRHIL